MSRQHANGNSILLPEPGEFLLLTFNLLALRVAQVLERSVRQEAGAQLFSNQCWDGNFQLCCDVMEVLAVDPYLHLKQRCQPTRKLGPNVMPFSQVPPPSTRVRGQLGWENVRSPLLT